MSRKFIFIACVVSLFGLWGALFAGAQGTAGEISIIFPEAGEVVNVGTLVIAEVPSPAGGTDEDEESDGIFLVEFDYSPDGIEFFPIEGPAPDEVPGYAVLWNAGDLPGGDYLLRVRLTWPSGLEEIDTIPVYVNEQPFALLEAEPGDSPLTVLFDASASFDPDGIVTGYLWEFGDGTIFDGPPVVTHEFPAPGEYGVSVTVFDMDEGESTAHHLILLEDEVVVLKEKSCGCKKMTVKVKGNVEGPAGFDFSPQAASGVPDSEKSKLGPFATPTSAAGQLDMTKASFTVKYRFEVIADLVYPSKPQLCAEGQRAKRTFKAGGTTNKKKGNKSSDPRYDSGKGKDDPYDPKDDATKTEQATCGFKDKDWCDDDYHGGGAADGSGNDGLQPPNGYKKYIDEKRIVWLDAPGFRPLSKNAVARGGASYQASFEAKVSGPLGECKCSWEVHIKIDKKGKIKENKVKNIKCQ